MLPVVIRQMDNRRILQRSYISDWTWAEFARKTLTQAVCPAPVTCNGLRTEQQDVQVQELMSWQAYLGHHVRFYGPGWLVSLVDPDHYAIVTR